MIGGIFQNEKHTNYDKDPPGGPGDFSGEDAGFPLFSFVKSKSFVISKSQFVVFVTPEIIESASTGTAEIKRKFKQRHR